MRGYLLDTNICIYYMKGHFDLKLKLENVGVENCYISEITLAELKFGVENSQHIERNREALNVFLSGVKIIPIFHSLDIYAIEKARLKKIGKSIDDFDLLIGSTAVDYKCIMVTKNIKHFEGISKIKIEDWTT